MFINLTGRFDLVVDTTDYVDISANFFINQGQKFLDSRIPHGAAVKGRIITGIGQGENMVEVPFARAVHQVVLIVPGDNGGIDEVYHLEHRDYQTVLATASSIDSGTLIEGMPKYWSRYPSRIADEFSNDQDIIRSIALAPAPDKEYQIEVFGTFLSRPFTSDESQTYWSVAYPDILLQAAMYKLEVTYRNTEGANDHLRVIDEALQGMYFDYIEEDTAGKNQMRNSW